MPFTVTRRLVLAFVTLNNCFRSKVNHKESVAEPPLGLKQMYAPAKLLGLLVHGFVIPVGTIQPALSTPSMIIPFVEVDPKLASVLSTMADFVLVTVTN